MKWPIFVDVGQHLSSHGGLISHDARVLAMKFAAILNSLQQEVCSEPWQVSLQMQSN